jgi:uncharacterized protein YhaN
MRINRLDLIRYGKFTDHVIDFGRPQDGAPDLHLVYGPNEAGKSTLFNAWLDLLFGIGQQSSYNFLHPYPAMRIGASVELDGDDREVIRIKRPQNSLLDAADQPMAEAALSAALGGLDRDGYRTMFSLDDETLEQGGESILASRGDLGELLFSASAGLGALSQNLDSIRKDAEAFYKSRAQNRQLTKLKSDLAELKAERDRLDTQATAHARLSAVHEDAVTRHAEASLQRRNQRLRMQEIDSILHALPRARDLGELEDKLASFEGVPDAGPEQADDIARMRERDARLEAGSEALEQQLDRLTMELDAIRIDETILGLRDRISDLDKLRARHATAEDDIPKLKLTLGEADAEINQLLFRLGRRGEADPEALLLSASIAAALTELIDQRTGLDARLSAAKKETADARTILEDAKSALRLASAADTGQPAEDRELHLAALSQAVAQARIEDHGLRLQSARRGLEKAREVRDQSLLALSPWKGEMTELLAMNPPDPEAIADWKRELEELARKQARLDDEIERLGQALRRLEAERAAITGATDLELAAKIGDLRQARDRAWASHKTDLGQATADVFEAAMTVHDKAVDQQTAFQADAARLKELSVQAATAQADLNGANAARQKLVAKRAAIAERWSGRIAAMAPALASGATPGALEDWLHRRRLALEAELHLQGLESQIQDAARDRQVSTDRLIGSLKAAGDPAPDNEDFDALLLRADTLVNREARLEGLRRSVDASRRDLERRETELRAVEEQAKAWILAWKKACSKCWLGEQDRVPTPVEAREILDLLTQLGPAVTQRASLLDRIEKMERDQSDYARAVGELAADAEIASDDGKVYHLARRLEDALKSAEAAERGRAALFKQREDLLARQRSLSDEFAAHTKLKSELLTALGAKDLSEAAHRVAQSLERRATVESIHAIQRQLCEALGTATLDDAIAQLRDADRTALEQQSREIAARIETLDLDIEELHAARSRAAEALEAIGGDDAVARIEQQRQTTIEAIAEGASRYLRLSAGILAMEQALALYREQHRSTMMARASEAVKTISRGRYSGLASQPGKDGELLIALTADGGSKQAGEMSKGARFQLYLALRVAGYHEFAQMRPTVPFIADDIMETFDDFRAEETFRLLAGMADVGQVIYLTHHRHLCDIAKSVCPTVHIHELAA